MAKTARLRTQSQSAVRFARLILCGLLLMIGCAFIEVRVFAQALGAKTDPASDWEVKAGGPMSFEVAAIHADSSEKSATTPIFLISKSDSDLPAGGRFHADTYLPVYITFAYKLRLTNALRQELVAQLPEWASSQSFLIDARGPEYSTKDQVRLMMRSLLAERFHFAMHFEGRTIPAFDLILDRPGVTGPRLHRHIGGDSCFDDNEQPRRPGADSSNANCRHFWITGTDHVQQRMEARDLDLEALADSIPIFGNFDKPVIDRTGLPGTYDFTVEWAPETDRSLPQMEETAFLDELKRQLGLRLKPSMAQVRVPIVDHVERPTAN